MKRKSEYQRLIVDELDSDTTYDSRLPAQTCHKMYVEVTGNKARPFKGRGWHIRKVNNALQIEMMKSYQHNSVRIPQNILKQWLEYLQQQ
jgi:hypothetical protein